MLYTQMHQRDYIRQLVQEQLDAGLDKLEEVSERNVPRRAALRMRVTPDGQMKKTIRRKGGNYSWHVNSL